MLLAEKLLINRLGKYVLSQSYSDFQKQPPRGVPRKRCSENMQQIYRRTPMPKCDFNKVAFQNTFSQEHLWVLLDFSFSDFSDFSLEDYLPTCEGLVSRLMILICLLTLVMFPASTITIITRKPRCNFDTFNNFC